MNQTEMKKIAAEVRKNIVRMTCAAQSGHPGGSLSAVEILVSLYFNEMKINEENVNDVFRSFNQWEELKRAALTGFWRDLKVFLYSLLLIIPGIVKSYSYRFVPYLTEDEPDLDPQQILALSQEMTQGIKLDLFVLDLSFFLWYVLGAITFNIGTYFIHPYIYQTDAECYLEVRSQYYGGMHENWD